LENPLWLDILAQGKNLGNVVRHLYGPERANLEAAAEFLRSDLPIVMVGISSAEYVSMPAAVYLGQKGRPAFTLCASEAVDVLLPMLRRARVVINSRSGETAEVVRLARALQENGIPFVAVTNSPQSTLSRMAARVVWCNTRKDDLISINVVTGMMAATLALAAATAGELDEMRPQFEALAAAMPGVVERAVQQAAQLRSQLQAMFHGVRPIYLLYRGPSKGSAFCGRLALEEVSRCPAIAMQAAEFRQGPNEVIDENFGAVVFAGDGKPAELSLALARDILRSGGRVMLVGNAAPDALSGKPGNYLVFPIQGIPDVLRPVLDVVPLQVLAYEQARAKGITPGQVRFITKVIVNEEGMPSPVVPE
jgi:glucosamine--fructose-6-phosphate aminotransferase (isomerizing)